MSFPKRTIKDIELKDKTVLMRADYNVPLHSGVIADDLRLRASLPTLEYLLGHHCKVIVMSHMGRPDGRVDKKYSLEPVATRLGELLGRPVVFVEDCIGDKVRQAVKKAPKGAIIMLENLRFHAEEEENDAAFARKLARDSGANVFVQDGFGVVHRAHASTDAITQELPSVAGLLLEREYEVITQAMERPHRPLVAVLGGAKVSDKISIVERFVDVADRIIVGGAMANTFLRYKGYDMGASLLEKDQEKVLDAVYQAAHDKLDGSVDEFIVLPTDVAVAKNPTAAARRRVVKLDNVGADDKALDIGDASIERLIEEVADAGTVIWNGTLGYAELPAFAHGSARLALALATQPQTTSVIGGGDTADFILDWSGDDGAAFSHVSTGGGASLDLMAGKTLPGVDSLLAAPR